MDGGRNCSLALTSSGRSRPMGELCHCGRTAARTQQPDPWEGRLDGYCDDCAAHRCDCTPDECPVKYPPTVPARRPVDDALDRLVDWASWRIDRPSVELIAATIREALERLREERDAADSQVEHFKRLWGTAEAEVRRLNRYIDQYILDVERLKAIIAGLLDRDPEAHDKARALLSADPPQGDAADFCEHGYTTEDSAHPSAGLERCPTCSPSDGGGA